MTLIPYIIRTWNDLSCDPNSKSYTHKELTIGNGFTFLTKNESLVMLKGRTIKIANKLNDRFYWFKELSPIRQTVIISMVFQLGVRGFLKFKNTIKAIKNNDFEEACIQMRDSRAYRQTQERWDRQITMFRIG